MSFDFKSGSTQYNPPSGDHAGDRHRAGAGRTTRDLPPRPTAELPQSEVVQARAAAPAPTASWQASYEDCWALVSGHPVQARAERTQAGAADEVQTIAAQGVAGPGDALPHLDTIQRSFGDHDVSGIRAHIGGEAASAAQSIGAAAYATGSHVAFAASPDLHLAAHEAAHVVQQRAGVHLKGGVGQAGDAYEVHADMVADRVVAGLPAADLLAALPGGHHGGLSVQRKGADEAPTDRGAAKMSTHSSESSALTDAWNDLDSAEKAARDVLRAVDGGADPIDAYQRVTTILQGMLRPLGVYLQAAARKRTGNANAMPWEAPTEEGRALDADQDNAAAAVNNTLRVALILEQRQERQAAMSGGRITAGLRGPQEAAIANLRATRGAVSAVATQVGWTPPTTVAEANAARYAHEACPTGGKEERGAAHCKFDDTEREKQRRLLDKAVVAAIAAFGSACQKHVTALDKAIAKNKESSDLLIDLFSKSIGTAIEIAAPGLGKVASAAIDVTLDIATDYAKERAGDAGASGDKREKTKGMLGALLASMTKRLTEASTYSDRLDDHQLLEAVSEINKLDVPFFQARVDAFVAAFRSQIEPLGHGVTEGTPFGYPSATTKYKSVKVKAGKSVRFAQVAHEAQDLDGTQILLGHDVTHHSYKFMRWIDPEFEPMIADSPTIEPDQITGLPMGPIMDDMAKAGPKPAAVPNPLAPGDQ